MVPAILISPFEVSASLKEEGYSGEVLARRLLDGLREIESGRSVQRDSVVEQEARNEANRAAVSIDQGARATMAKQPATPRAFMLASGVTSQDFEIPKTGISRDLLVQLVRLVIGDRRTRVDGEVVKEGDRLRLNLRVLDRDTTLLVMREKLDGAMLAAAAFVTKVIAPITLAEYYFGSKPRLARDMVLYCLQNNPVDDDAAAYELLGRLYGTTEPELALASFRRALQLDPRLARAHTNKGLIFLVTNQYDSAAAEFFSAAGMQGVDVGKNTNALGLAMERAGDTASARRIYQAAIAADPTDPAAYLNLGSVLAKGGAYAAAEEQYRLALQRQPTLGTAWVNWAVSLLYQNRTDSAVATLREALAADRRYAPAYRLLGDIRRQSAETPPPDGDLAPPSPTSAFARLRLARFRKDMQAALALYDSAAALDSADAKTWLALSSTFLALGNDSAARHRAERALRLDSTVASPHVLIGGSWMRQHRYEAALQAFERAAGAEPRNSYAVMLAGVALLRLNRPADAEQRFRRALHLNPRYEDPWIGIAWSLLNRGRFDSARALVVELIRRDGGSYSADEALALGWADLRLGRRDSAEARFQSVATMSPLSAQPYVGWGMIRLAGNDPREQAAADLAFRTALELSPDDPDALVGRGMVAARRRPPQAMKFFCAAMASDSLWADSYREAGRLLVAQGRRARGAAYLRRAATLDREGYRGREADALLRRLGPTLARTAPVEAKPIECRRR